MELKIYRFIFLLLLISKLSSAQISFDPTALDTQLAKITTDLIAEETKISQMLTNQSTKIQSALANIQNMTDLINSLNTAVTTMTKQMTAKNYAKYQPIETCSDVNVKITEIVMDVQKFQRLATCAYANATALYQQNLWISYYYTLNILKLGIGSDNQKNVFNIIQQVNSVVVEYLTYVNMLLVNASIKYGLSLQLNLFKQKYCKCSSTFSSSVAANVSTLDSNIQQLEVPLIARQKQLINISNVALGHVQAALPPALLSSSPTLQSTVTFLKNLATISDYSQSPWTNTTSCTALLSRIGYVTYKYWIYVQAYTYAAQNFTFCAAYQNNLNLTVLYYNSSLNAVQYTSIVNAIQVMVTMQNLYTDYMQKLFFAVNRLLLGLIDIQALGDSFCACSQETGSTVATTIASTSSSSPSTSTTTTTTVPSTSTSTTTTVPSTSTSTTTVPSTSTSTTTVPSTTSSTTTTTSSTTTTTVAPSTSTSTEPSTTTTTGSTTSTTTTVPSTTTTTQLSTTTPESTTTTQPSTTTTTTTTTASGFFPEPRDAIPTEPASTTTVAPLAAAPTATTTTTTTPTTTTKAPVCQYTYRVNSSANVYIKTLCYISTPMGHSAASSYCTANGMSFYAITDADSFNGYKNFINSHFPTGTMTFLGNGATTGNKNWNVYSNPSTALYSGITYTAAMKNGQACAIFTRSASLSFTAAANDCNLGEPFMCEFI